MKPLYLIITFFGALSISRSDATTLLLDDFSSGGFSLSPEGTRSNSGPFVTPLTDQRTIAGVGSPNWTATLTQGDVSYSVNQLDPRPRRNYLQIRYSLGSGSFSLDGYDAFAVDVFDVVGSGEFIAFVDGFPAGDIRIPINGPGTLVSPFTGLDTSQSLESLTQMNFYILAISADFSLTVDNVRVVPEPSTSFLFVLGILFGLFRRRRQNPWRS